MRGCQTLDKNHKSWRVICIKTLFLFFNFRPRPVTLTLGTTWLFISDHVNSSTLLELIG
jgi:hypothetical protein